VASFKHIFPQFLGVFENKPVIWRMASSGMLRRVALVITDASEELSALIIRVTRISELGKLAVTPTSPIPVTLMMEALSSSETLVPTRDIWRNIPEDAIHRYENLKSYKPVISIPW
jgi:hypothetical protein